MTDIVEILRGCDDPMMQAAADEIERLRGALQTIVDGIPVVRAKSYRCDGVVSKMDYCPHGLHVYEDCSACIEDFARAAKDWPF